MRKAPMSPAMALLPLRLFLGVTFVYAGIQKLSDPGFLHAGSTTYIGTQLHAFAAGTPGGFILRTFALPHPELAGIGVALTEILVGLLAGAGLFTRVAAAVGLSLNFLLFLTASWHVSPYFLGPDLVFSFAWLPFVLVGAEGQPALDNAVERASAALARRTRLRVPETGAQAEPASTRRVLLAELAGMAVAIAGISALSRGAYSAARSIAATSTASGHSTAGAGSVASSGGSSKLPSGAVRLGPGKRLPAGQAATYADPSDGSPDILIRDEAGDLKAFSAVCTHAGCTVGYEGGTIVCPCHGARYSAETGEPIGGPAPSGLAPKKVLEAGGQIYAVPS
ncbi:MAG: TQO small subunit DoxD [Chloroflexota bacterium]